MADDVADGEDVGHVGALLAVDGDESSVVHGDPRGLGADAVPVGPPADRHEHPIEGVRVRRLGALEAHREVDGQQREAG